MAQPTVRILPTLNPQHVSLGLRILSGDRIHARTFYQGDEISWSDEGGVLVGRIEVEVPEASVIQCFLSYKGSALHYGWLSDPDNTQNARRTVLEAFDPKFAICKELVLSEPGKGRSGSSADLEIGVTWLLWVLGFSSLHLGGSRKASDAFDVLAVSPKGDYAVVECTTGLLNAHNKLSKLVSRSIKVSEVLARSGNGNAKVLPIMVTSRTRSEVRADLEQAAKLGVVVLAREELVHALEVRTKLRPDANALYAEAEALIADIPNQTTATK